MCATEGVHAVRTAAAELFDTEPEQVIFTQNCTHALNLAIHGILRKGGHVVLSSLEHNSVSRPIEYLRRNGSVTYSVAPVSPDDDKTVEAFAAAITPKTKAIACTLASNVTGQILPWRRIAALCKERGICMIADGAQACGLLPVSLKRDGINLLCTAGHKALYGASGTGMLLTDGHFPIEPLMQGGTGSTSLSLEQPEFLPDSLESGTVNTTGILSLGAGIDFIRRMGMDRIFRHESALCRQFLNETAEIPGFLAYRDPAANYVPLVSFTLGEQPPEETASLLDEAGFCLRAGYLCAALAHQQLGTKRGTVRFAPSVFNTAAEVHALTETLKKLRKIQENP